MSKELIELAREAGLDIPDDDPAYNLEFNLEELGVFANLVAEKQQSWIDSLEQHAKDADRMYKELETELAEQQMRIAELEAEIERKISAGNYVIEQLTTTQAQIKVLRDALENCRLFAARRRAEEWATHILRLCESGGSVANPLRQDDSALHERLKAERERCAKVADEWQTAIHDPRYQCDCATAIRAMEDQ